MSMFRDMGRHERLVPMRPPAPPPALDWPGIGPGERRDGWMGPCDARFDPCGAPPEAASSDEKGAAA